MYLFLDLKTKGVLGDKNKPYTCFDLQEISITKIAWLLVNEKNEILEKKYFIALGEGFVGNQDFEKYSSSSEATINKTYDLQFLFEHLMKNALKRAEVIVYNDIGIKDNLLNYLYSREIMSTNTPFEEKDRLCILEESKLLFAKDGVDDTFGLSLLYQKLFGDKLSDDIDLLDSLAVMSKCFFRLKETKFFCFKESKIQIPELNLPSGVIPDRVKSIKGIVCKIINDDKIDGKQPLRYTYDIQGIKSGNGSTVEIKHHNANNTLTSWKEHTYQNVNLINVKVFNAKKGLISEKQYGYDYSGKPDQIEYFNGKNESLGTKSFRYNCQGFLISEFINKTDWSFIETNYRYNGLGGTYVEQMHYETDANFNKEYSKIDHNGILVEKIRFKGFTPNCVTLFMNCTYDKNNNLSEKTVTKQAGDDSHLIYKKILRYEYSYDHENNWVNKVEIVDDTPSFSEKREITYF